MLSLSVISVSFSCPGDYYSFTLKLSPEQLLPSLFVLLVGAVLPVIIKELSLHTQISLLHSFILGQF